MLQFNLKGETENLKEFQYRCSMLHATQWDWPGHVSTLHPLIIKYIKEEPLKISLVMILN
jgi:hypothetical protein